MQAGYDKARGEDQIARQEVRRVTNDLRYEADVRYWNRVAQCELVSVADRYRTSVAQLVAVVRERVELEYTDRNDLLMAEVRLNDADYRSERARNEAEVARLSLNALAGIPSGEQILTDTLVAVPSLAGLSFQVEDALLRRPEMQMAETNIGVQQSAARMANARYLPSLSVGVDGNYSSPGYDFRADLDPNYSVYAKLSVPIFEWGKRRHTRNKGRYQVDIARERCMQVADGLRLEVETARCNYQQAMEQVRLTESSLRKAAESETLALDKYREGSVSIVEVINAQLYHLEAQQNHIRSKLNACLAKVHCSGLVGKDKSLYLRVYRRRCTGNYPDAQADCTPKLPALYNEQNRTRMRPTRQSYIWDILLYSGLGCFSYFFLVRFADIPLRHQDRLLTPQAFVAVMLLFNGVGLGMRYIRLRLRSSYPAFLDNRRRMVLFLVLSALFLFALNYLLLVSVKLLLDIPHPFQLVYKGTRLLLITWLTELVIVSQSVSNRFYRDLLAAYRRTQQLEESALQARYMALQSQLNPHFLFNSLNTLIAEIEYNPQGAVGFTRNLSDVYRYILTCQDKRLVSLHDEMGFVDTYVQLHRVRLGDCLTVDWQVADAIREEAQLPPLTLQLLVENIVKHNVISPSRPMTVTVEALTDGEGSAWLRVSNPVHPKLGAVSGGHGLKNLAQRYRLLCGKEIVVEKQENCFDVKVPLLYE